LEKDVRVNLVRVSGRHRKDYGDILALAESIQRLGLLQPIGVDSELNLIFGERRLIAHRRLGRETIPARVIDLDDPLQAEFDENETHKPWLPSERVAIKKALTAREGRPNKNGAHVHRLDKHEAAKKAGFDSYRTAALAEGVVDKGAPELVDAMDSGRASIRAAADLASLPKDEQAEVVARGESEILRRAKEIRAAKQEKRREERTAKVVELAKREHPLAFAQRFPVVYADPPWKYDYTETESRAIENQYPTMDIDDICALPVGDIAAQDAILFLWATSPKLEESLRVLAAWGFNYRTCAVWDKEIIGMGYYFRQQHELLLVGTRGDIPAPPAPARPPSIIRHRREKHSTKPDAVRDAIAAMYPDFAKIELFCRDPRDGWEAWGNEAGSL